MAVTNIGEVGGKKNVMTLIKMVRVVNKIFLQNDITIAHFDFSSALAQPIEK